MAGRLKNVPSDTPFAFAHSTVSFALVDGAASFSYTSFAQFLPPLYHL